MGQETSHSLALYLNLWNVIIRLQYTEGLVKACTSFDMITFWHATRTCASYIPTPKGITPFNKIINSSSGNDKSPPVFQPKIHIHIQYIPYSKKKKQKKIRKGTLKQNNNYISVLRGSLEAKTVQTPSTNPFKKTLTLNYTLLQIT